MNIQKGAIVKVRAFGGRVLMRRFAGSRGEIALICNDEEYQASIKENREPICIGFRVEDIVDTIKRKNEKGHTKPH